MPPISYDGRSLVPDINQALGIALGMAERKATERKDEQRKAEAAGLTDQLLDPSVADPMQNPETIKVLMRLRAVDPQAAQWGVSLLQARDEKQLQQAKEEAKNASLFFQSVLDTDDPVERTRFISQTIREREEKGQDTTKLRELMGLDATKQKLFARRQIILAGDGATLADHGLEALKAQLEIQNLQLEGLQKRQKIEADAREAAQGKYTDVASMRDDYVKQSQKYVGVRDAYSSLQAALAQASPAGDVAGIFGFMKALDPNSSVREGEQATAQNSGGVPDSIRGLYNKAIGEGGLTPERRADFLRTARGQLETAQRSQDKLRSEFSRLAQLRSFNPEEVLVDFSAPPAPAQPAAAGAAPKVTTKAEYDALPSGSVYTDPNGVQRRKR